MDTLLIINAENARGLNKNTKRSEYFAWLKTKNDRDFTIVTETKCHEESDMATWSRQWSCDENDSIWSIDRGKTGKKGVVILVHPKFKKRNDAKINLTKVDPCGGG